MICPRAQFKRLAAGCQAAVFMLLSASFSSMLCYAEIDSIQRIQIDADSLSSALIQLGQQTGNSIVFPARLLYGRSAENIDADISTRDALTRLLGGTSLGFQMITANVVAIVPLPASDNKTQGHSEELFVLGKPVTGSYIKRTDLQGSSPVSIVTEQELLAKGSQSLSQYFKFYPAVFGSGANTEVSNGGNGSATLTLRGLPEENTLILVNGKRSAYNGLRVNAVDLNMIPALAVKRVEVLKGGASALYGSDAVAGVVNIITKDHYDGFSIRQYYGESSRGDAERRKTELMWGMRGEYVSLMVAMSRYSQEALFSREREISNSADRREQEGIDQRSSATPSSRVTLDDGSTVILRAGREGNDATDYRAATAEDLYDYAGATSSVTPLEKNSVLLSAGYHFSADLNLNLMALNTTTESTITFAPTPVMPAFESQPFFIAEDNVFNPFAEDIHDIRRRMIELGPREQINDNETERIDVTLDGRAEGLHWEAVLSWNQVSSKELFTNLVDGEKLAKALGEPDDCLPSEACIPVNFFGPAGSITSEQIDSIRFNNFDEGNNEITAASVYLDGQLLQTAAGPVLAAVGLERRKEEAEINTLPKSQEGFVIGDDAVASLSGRRTISELFAELHVPLLNHKPMAYSLNLELAVRHSRYSDFGRNTTPRVALRYRPTAGLLLRANYAEGFRAPGLDELYNSTHRKFTFLNDPCADPVNVSELPGCLQQSDPTRDQFLAEFIGNPSLKPEEAENITFGFMLTPLSLPEFELELDFFSIKQDNVVGLSSPGFITLEEARGNSTGRVQRDSNGNIMMIEATFLNVGRREVSGADLAVHYRWSDTKWGEVKGLFAASYLHEYRSQLDPATPMQNIAGTFQDVEREGNGALPRWKANLGLSLQKPDWRFDYNLYYVYKLQEMVPMKEKLRKINSWLTHNLQLTYKPDESEGLSFALGVDNILDKQPPLVASSFNDNIDARTHSLIGRYWYMRLAYNFN